MMAADERKGYRSYQEAVLALRIPYSPIPWVEGAPTCIPQSMDTLERQITDYRL